MRREEIVVTTVAVTQVGPTTTRNQGSASLEARYLARELDEKVRRLAYEILEGGTTLDCLEPRDYEWVVRSLCNNLHRYTLGSSHSSSSGGRLV